MLRHLDEKTNRLIRFLCPVYLKFFDDQSVGGGLQHTGLRHTKILSITEFFNQIYGMN